MEQKKDMKNCWTNYFFLGGGEGNFLLLITHMGIVMVVLIGCWSQFFMRHLKPKKKINQTNVSEKEQMDPIIQNKKFPSPPPPKKKNFVQQFFISFFCSIVINIVKCTVKPV
jgi:hypothetical protein